MIHDKIKMIHSKLKIQKRFTPLLANVSQSIIPSLFLFTPQYLTILVFVFFFLILFPDQAFFQKMNEKISSQEMKLTFLQKKVDSIAAAMNDVSKMLSSLEGKINEDKGRDFQSILKGKKKKLM